MPKCHFAIMVNGINGTFRANVLSHLKLVVSKCHFAIIGSGINGNCHSNVLSHFKVVVPKCHFAIIVYGALATQMPLVPLTTMA